MNTFRRDPITGQIVIIAAERDSRPNQFLTKKRTATAPQDQARDACQFCADQMQTPPILARYGEAANHGVPWQVCVVPNLYPSLTPPADGLASSAGQAEHLTPLNISNPSELFSSTIAQGFHEVIIESPTHETQAGDLSQSVFKHMLRAYRDRTKWMYDQGARYVQVIKNSGEAAGASVRHTHSQIFGIPFVPEHVARELKGADDFFDGPRDCLFCQILEQELAVATDSRIVATTEEFVAWCPFASRVGYELQIAPRVHAARFEDSSDSLLDKLAVLLRSLIGRLDEHPRVNAFNYLIHSLPPEFESTASYHWHIEILPRIAKEAGFEWGTGVNINTVPPEQAAKELRD